MYQGQVPPPEPLSVGDAPVEGAATAAADILPSFPTSCMPCLRPRRLTPWCLCSAVEHIDQESQRQRSELTRPGESPGYCIFSKCLEP